MLLSLITYALIWCTLSLADTEIRNFRLPLALASPSAKQAALLPTEHTLASSTKQLVFNLTNSHPSTSFQLTMDEPYPTWTVRLSWPGSTPTKFSIDLQPHPSINNQITLHVAASPLSPRLPISHNPSSSPSIRAITYPLRSRIPADPDPNAWSTPIHVILEPLLLGVIPRTAVPAIGWIIVFALGAAFAVPHILRMMAQILVEAEERGKAGRVKVE